ncbi:biopolymer transporter ExbD [Spongiibacter nanhainus]|uniref:Biopolymer transporter ExbD n=1 Tax=Spongiibacter nanhainus TaxID=2794344 RepID=A0A7T4QXX6_9GAMM|nr:biopolymer transporter ExbD [Spongiibacter nanhainus]QQD16714.1 biopolymer transporter ExbD [Spongiibacter nanhainus]
MNFKRQRPEEGGINLTPLIDVVFLLLIFFMVSTTFTKETHIKLDLPQAEGEAGAEARDNIEVVVSADGRYRVNEVALASADIGDLMTAMERASGGNTELPVVITGDAKAPHQAVITAMDAAGRMGFVHLSLTARQPDG